MRIAEDGVSSSRSLSCAAHMSDLVSENQYLKERLKALEQENSNLLNQREAEMLSVVNVIREFEQIIRRHTRK